MRSHSRQMKVEGRGSTHPCDLLLLLSLVLPETLDAYVFLLMFALPDVCSPANYPLFPQHYVKNGVRSREDDFLVTDSSQDLEAAVSNRLALNFLYELEPGPSEQSRRSQGVKSYLVECFHEGFCICYAIQSIFRLFKCSYCGEQDLSVFFRIVCLGLVESLRNSLGEAWFQSLKLKLRGRS
jgi:hypothetical protein